MLGSMKIINYLDYRPQYHIDKCIKSKSSKSTCNKCYEACPYDAIEVYRKGIKITDDCNFCGICTSYCPSNAITDGGRRFCRSKDEIFVICSVQEKKDINNKNIKVNCLKFFSSKILMNLYVRGIRKIYINTERCKGCSYTHDLEKELEFTNNILSELNKEAIEIEKIQVDEIYNGLNRSEERKSKKTVDRRNFFKELAKEVFSFGYEIAPPIMKEDGWKEINEIIRSLETEEVKNISMYNVNIDYSKCIDCNACMKLCPKGVWKKTDDILETREFNCNGCSLCLDICPTKAIDLVKNAHKSLPKMEEKVAKSCNTCGKEFKTYFQEKLTCHRCVSKNVFRTKTKVKNI